MPEDFKNIWFSWNQINPFYDLCWQYQYDFQGKLEDRDLFCMYSMMSI